MVTRELWGEIGDGSPLFDRSDLDINPTKLGAWSAKCVHLPEGHFCIAVNETTYMTVAMPLVPLPELLLAFGFSVGSQLESLHIPEPDVITESRAFLEGTAFAKNSNRSLLGSLNDLEGHFAIAMKGVNASGTDSLLRIQHELNRIPHAKRAAPFPDQATSLLFKQEGSALS